jgi:hypothetical protein
VVHGRRSPGRNGDRKAVSELTLDKLILKDDSRPKRHFSVTLPINRGDAQLCDGFDDHNVGIAERW